tara:strand:- start:315 stop:512 length:198 start_codon:yes stop_codon:yes gene_type:complete
MIIIRTTHNIDCNIDRLTTKDFVDLKSLVIASVASCINAPISCGNELSILICNAEKPKKTAIADK